MHYLKLTTEDGRELYLLGFDPYPGFLIARGYAASAPIPAGTPLTGDLGTYFLKEDVERETVVVTPEDVPDLPWKQRRNEVRLEQMRG